MLRAENLKVEIFIDDDDDMTYAEALMFTTSDKRLLARGHARLVRCDTDGTRTDDRWIAVVALQDLMRSLIQEEPAPGAAATLASATASQVALGGHARTEPA
jgi:hypothetical protein